MSDPCDDFHQALGAAKKEAGRDTSYVQLKIQIHGQEKQQTVAFYLRLFHLSRPLQIIL